MKPSLFEPAPTVARINVTPIIDVALVLVIILLITAPMIATPELEVALPLARTRGADSEARVHITLSASGEVALDDQVLARSQLAGSIAARVEEDGEQLVVVVRADQGVSYNEVEGILKLARGAGATRLAIATQNQKGSQ